MRDQTYGFSSYYTWTTEARILGTAEYSLPKKEEGRKRKEKKEEEGKRETVRGCRAERKLILPKESIYCFYFSYRLRLFMRLCIRLLTL